MIIADILHMQTMNVENHLYQLVYESRFDAWIQFQLIEVNLAQRIFIYDSLQKRKKMILSEQNGDRR